MNIKHTTQQKEYTNKLIIAGKKEDLADSIADQNIYKLISKRSDQSKYTTTIPDNESVTIYHL
ncbi:MAG TPA: hypothetical protein VJ951_04010, partial [Bacteroidales bacterium]|nr:hypothetical protein [Bacteroidales bacterium]